MPYQKLESWMDLIRVYTSLYNQSIFKYSLENPWGHLFIFLSGKGRKLFFTFNQSEVTSKFPFYSEVLAEHSYSINKKIIEFITSALVKVYRSLSEGHSKNNLSGNNRRCSPGESIGKNAKTKLLWIWSFQRGQSTI